MMVEVSLSLTPELAEIAGIHAGDGHLRNRKNEFELSGNVDEREYYDLHVIPLFNKVFFLDIKGKYYPTKGTYGFSVSDKNLSSSLTSLGFPKGNKSLVVSIPSQILSSSDSTLHFSFLRGIFDTDGSVTFDKKIYNKDSFKKIRHFYPRIMFTTVSKNLAIDIQSLCLQYSFPCSVYTSQSKKQTESLKYKLQIVGDILVQKWFSLVKPANPTKISRFLIWKKHGFCPPNTTYEQRKKILKGETNPHTYYGLVV